MTEGLKDTFWVNVCVCYLDGGGEFIDVYQSLNSSDCVLCVQYIIGHIYIKGVKDN